MTEFTIWCLFIGLGFNITGIQYQYFPPKKFRWWGPGVRHPAALRNMDTWTAANKSVAIYVFVTGSIFIAISFLPEVIGWKNFFTFKLVITLMAFTSLILNLLIYRHLNNMFDKDGNRRR